MKVRMKTCLVGGDFAIMPGSVYECDADEAARLIEADLAEPVKAGAETRETTTISAPETSGRGRRKSA